MAWGPALLWAAFLVFLGSRPPSQLPGGGLLAFPGADKAVHACAYAVLGALVQRAAPPVRFRGTALLGALAALAVGGLDEILQIAVPGRSADPWDLAADVAGAAAGAVLARRTFPRRGRSHV